MQALAQAEERSWEELSAAYVQGLSNAAVVNKNKALPGILGGSDGDLDPVSYMCEKAAQTPDPEDRAGVF